MKNLIMTVNFLFTPDLKEVLMIKKNRGPYPDHYNGIGGKFDHRLDRLIGDGKYNNLNRSARREILEESGVIIEPDQLYWIVTEIFPPGETPPWGDGNTKIELAVFCGIIEKDWVKQIEDEKLEWIKLRYNGTLIIDTLSQKLAGDGNVPYFIELALKRLRQVQEKGE